MVLIKVVFFGNDLCIIHGITKTVLPFEEVGLGYERQSRHNQAGLRQFKFISKFDQSHSFTLASQLDNY